jgi:DNA polymerase III epsilon subunit-like protein
MIKGADLRDVLTLTRPLVGVDVETHDFCPPEKAYIVEIGIQVFYPDPSKPVYTYETFVRPPGEVRIHPAASEKHNITNDEVFKKHEDGRWFYPTFAEIGQNIRRGFNGCDFIGYNGGFDLRAIKASMTRVGIAWDYDNAHLVDPLALWRKLMSRTLSDAVREFAGREPTDAHRALADISDTIDVFVGMHKRLGLPSTVEECAKLAKDPERIGSEGKFMWKGDTAIICFGKWNGTPLNSQNGAFKGYLGWMVRDGDFAPDTKKICMDALAGVFPKKESV